MTNLERIARTIGYLQSEAKNNQSSIDQETLITIADAFDAILAELRDHMGLLSDMDQDIDAIIEDTAALQDDVEDIYDFFTDTENDHYCPDCDYPLIESEDGLICQTCGQLFAYEEDCDDCCCDCDCDKEDAQ